MGRHQKDYSKGKIYLIRNTLNELLYVGSTCQTVAQRMTAHRSFAKNTNKIGPIYIAMRELGADNFYIELFADYPCERGEQLTRREGEVMRELGTLKTGYNKNQAGRTRAEYQAEYVKNNAADIKVNNAVASAKYIKNNAAAIKVRKAAWYLKRKAAKAAQSIGL